MRNDCIKLAKFLNAKLPATKNKNLYCLMPDDSWSLVGFDKSCVLSGADVYMYNIKHTNNQYGVTYGVQRLFKSHMRFIDPVHEHLEIDSGHTVERLHCHFEDNVPDSQRTLDRLHTDLQLMDSVPETARITFYRASTYQLLGDLEKAEYWYRKRLTYPEFPEERFLTCCYLAKILEDPTFYLQAIDEYPDRAAEAYYYLYVITGDIEWIKIAKTKPLGEYKLTLYTGVYDYIQQMIL